jgi:hypothetical protein
MKYVKLFEEFRVNKKEKVLDLDEIELSDKTIDDVLKPGFFDDDLDDESYIDKNGIIHIKNWNQY